jgi:lipid-A-disaccharide synthase-like uncharacterized protein
MDAIHNLLWHDGKFLGADWSVWLVIGWIGNAIFASRFVVQWYATEKRRQVSVPVAFWWLSLVGALTLLCYAIHDKHSVWIFAYAFTWIPYIRNLVIHYRHQRAQRTCPDCGVLSPPSANFCAGCGARLVLESSARVKA